MSTYIFKVPGQPFAWQRAGLSRDGRHYTKAETAAFERKVALYATQVGCEPIEGPVRLAVEAFFQMPEMDRRVRTPAKARPKSTKPDIDNLLKGVLDALNGIAYVDDAQVAEITGRKWFAAQDVEPYTLVLVASMGE